MSDVHVAPDVVVPPVTPAETASTPIDVTEAARALSAWRSSKKAEPPPEKVEAEPPQQLAETPSDDQPPADPVETTDTPDPAELPPIEPPRSWTKEEQAEFATYPREAQEKIARREQERDKALRQSQNEAAEKFKAMSAKEQAVEEARKQYETALPQILQTLQDAQSGAFADIKTQADVERLAQEDPFRYLQWDAHQKKVAAVQREFQATQERQAWEWQTKWAEFAEREDKLTAERIPELADPEKRTKLQEGAISYLKDTGFTETDLGQLWNGQTSLSLRDHRVQGLIRDAVKFREAQEAAKKAVSAKPLPPVQKPGVAQNKGAQIIANIEAAANKLSNAKGNAAVEAGMELLRAQRAAARK